MPNDKFYTSKEWRKLRNYKLSLNPFCQRCKFEIATEVHHIKDRKDFPLLELDIKNLESLCKPCHSTHTASHTNREFKPYKLKHQ